MDEPNFELTEEEMDRLDAEQEMPPPRKAFRRARYPAPPVYRAYDSERDQLKRVESVTAAFVDGSGVSTDGICDLWHLVAKVITWSGESHYILLYRSGWLPLKRVYEDDGDSALAAKRPRFQFSTHHPYEAGFLQLSFGDRQKLAHAILETFMGPVDPVKLDQWKRRKWNY